MARKRSEVPEMEKTLQYGRKKFVRYDEGAKIYSMGLHTFQDLAKEAGAIYRIKRVITLLVGTVFTDVVPLSEVVLLSASSAILLKLLL